MKYAGHFLDGFGIFGPSRTPPRFQTPILLLILTALYHRSPKQPHHRGAKVPARGLSQIWEARSGGKLKVTMKTKMKYAGYFLDVFGIFGPSRTQPRSFKSLVLLLQGSKGQGPGAWTEKPLSHILPCPTFCPLLYSITDNRNIIR
jgi:hypothetical protein